MKKFYFLLFSILTSLSAVPYSFEQNGIYYNIIDESLRTVEVSPSLNSDYSGNIIIPKTVKPDNSAISYIVIGIGSYAFKDCTNLSSIEIPSSIENINMNAFENCLNLSSFTFPESIKYIGTSVFKNCRKLSTVQFNAIKANSGGRIQYGSPLTPVFENCLNLNSISMGENVEIIPKTLFACTPILKLSFPKSLKIIGEGAFMNCSSLSTVTFDVDCILSDVQDYAFSYCKALNNFSLPNSVKTIGSYTFQYCENLTEFPFSPNTEITNIGAYSFSACRGVTELYIPSKVTNIDLYAFEDCRNLKYIYFPETILNINKGAFDAIWNLPDIYCTSLTPPIVQKISYTSEIEEIFSNLDKSKCTLHVPQEALNKYQLSEPWNQFPNIVTDISPSSITLEEHEISLYVGDEYKFSPTLFPWFTEECKINYTSSSKSVADIDSNGVLHALKEGSTTVLITAGSCMTMAKVVVKSIYPSSVSISETSKEVYCGDEFDLIATIHPDNVTDKTLTWESSNEKICIVDQNGHVTAKAVGECWILANCQAKSGMCKISVKPIEVQSISINKNVPSLGGYIGNSIKLDVLILPDNATYKSLIWSIEDSDIASVDENGVLTFISVGHTKVKATANNGVFAERDITVYPRMPQTFSISPESISLNVGESYTFNVTMTPDNIDDRTVIWHSSDTDKVSIDDNGTVTALKPDCLVRICGIAANGLESDAYVEVKPIQAEEIVLSSDNIIIHCLADGDISYSDILSATILPESATNKTIKWTSSNEAVAFYNEFFECHIAVGEPGTAIITASSANGVSASCTVTVIQDVSEVTLDYSSIELKIGDSLNLTATVYPNNATDKTIEWISSNEHIASVSDDGKVIGISVGDCIISAYNGDNFASCNVKVTENSAIEGVNSTNILSIISQNSCIIISGAAHKSDAYIFDTTGNLIYNGTQREIPIKKGIYIVFIENKHFKVFVY